MGLLHSFSPPPFSHCEVRGSCAFTGASSLLRIFGVSLSLLPSLSLSFFLSVLSSMPLIEFRVQICTEDLRDGGRAGGRGGFPHWGWDVLLGEMKRNVSGLY